MKKERKLKGILRKLCCLGMVVLMTACRTQNGGEVPQGQYYCGTIGAFIDVSVPYFYCTKEHFSYGHRTLIL
ncbi:MAG: hypothetical protein IJ251_04050 [Oscillospiraceae bacterium]|nr:hypothetical protein [Oscillospiraceae bacterium]